MQNNTALQKKQAVIDIGSNSIRLTVYRVCGQEFKILFREKIMAGLASYVENGLLTAEGIDCACRALKEFQGTLKALEIAQAAVFATASLRNIKNTEDALAQIALETGIKVEVISGREEALFGYLGAMRELSITEGAFVDIGGASTEAVTFENGKITHSASFEVGSLSLYRSCVKKILPGPGSRQRIEEKLQKEIDEKEEFVCRKHTPLVCVGGTARAVLKLAVECCGLPQNSRCVTRSQLQKLYKILCRADKQAATWILRAEPGRIHTLIPGLMILQHMMDYFNADELLVSKYGVREGYLCQKILTKQTNDTAAPKTAN